MDYTQGNNTLKITILTVDKLNERLHDIRKSLGEHIRGDRPEDVLDIWKIRTGKEKNYCNSLFRTKQKTLLHNIDFVTCLFNLLSTGFVTEVSLFLSAFLYMNKITQMFVFTYLHRGLKMGL